MNFLLSEKQKKNNLEKNSDIEYEIYDDEVYNYTLDTLIKFDESKILEKDNIKMLLGILKRKIIDEEVYIKRLLKEFELISQFGFEKVFYQVHQILEIAGDIPHIIRGSAGSCLLCYLMNITDIDPVLHKIALSRFMHETRQDIPDIDIDFPSSKRDEIYKKIFTKWDSQVARISNHIMYKEKSAYREAIRNEGYRKFVPREYDLKDIFEDKEKIKNVKNKAEELIGSFRCYSLHCGGIVIFPTNVPDNLILREYDVDKTGFKGTQIWMNKDQVEDADMIKIDVLSNRGLSQLLDISKRPIIDYPLDDEKVYELFERGENIGITHSESRAMMKVFKTMKPKTIKEIAIALALIRPAAAKNYQKAEFLKDYTPYKYNSNKFIIFDDDATRYIKNLLNCSDSVADNYRRAFSKNKKAVKTQFKQKLYRVVKDKEQRDQINERLEQLVYYSFCKSHAYSYAQLVWALAYHKVHNPMQFWLSTLNNCNSSYRKWVHFREARKSGIKLVAGKKPFKLEGNKLVPVKLETKKYEKSIDELLNYGYWTSDSFLPNMHYKEYWANLTKKHTKIDKAIIEDKKIKYADFRGLIVTGRGYKKDDGKGYITFVTIASNDGVYHDLVLYGYHKVSKMLCLSGYGKIKSDGYVKWIDVIKWKSEWLN